MERAACALMVGCWMMTAAAQAPPPDGARLDLEAREGRNLNHLVRDGDVAAHLVLRSGTEPRILVAFPAGNSGVGLWFDPLPAAATWTLRAAPQVVHAVDDKGRPLRGIAADLTVAANALKVHEAVLSSVRVLRDYQQLGTQPGAVVAQPTVGPRTLTWSRDRLDGAAGYRLVLEVTQGELHDGQLRPGADGRIGLRITGLTGETPLTPLGGTALLADPASGDRTARDTLAFLAYREKFLAGSWRFDTYFGRDTLMSVRLLMPVLSADAVESGLASVLARLSPDGAVAHEEDIGEFAVLDHLKKDGTHSAAPVYDYKMIDSSYLLAPVTSAWLEDDVRARARAAAFLAAPAGLRTGSRGAALVSNLRFVLRSATAFATDPRVDHLIGLTAGFQVGDWRDSNDGLGGGHYPYDVNAVLVPAALTAAARLAASGLLAPYLEPGDRELFAGAAHLADVWRSRAAPLFEVSIDHARAVDAIDGYARALSVQAQPALAALPASDLRFHAIALDAAGAPVRVMNSDEGFALLFEDLDPAQVDRAVTTLIRPFPAGLMTEAGMLVANPVHAPPPVQAKFSRNAYHGTVVWSWQQALFAAGLARQLRRTDLPGPVRSHLLAAQSVLWSAIRATRSMQNSELWSWSFAGGHYRVAAFGAAAADADESNAAQLWSTVYLAVRPPQ